jgi:hypothetical protein
MHTYNKQVALHTLPHKYVVHTLHVPDTNHHRALPPNPPPPHTHTHQVFLLASKAGSVGINLVSARRMVIYDVPW